MESVCYSKQAVCERSSYEDGARKKVLKNLKKVLDKAEEIWYSNQAVCDTRADESSEKTTSKKVEKRA